MRHGTLLAILLALTAAASAQRRTPTPLPSTNPLGRSETAVAEGREIYRRSCTLCHGLEGAAGGRGPALAGERRYLRRSDDDLFAAIRNGIPGTEMPPGGLAENDAWKVVAYIRSLRATAADAFVPGDAGHGRTIFWSKGRCGDCHMMQGRGGLQGPDLSNLGGERTLRAIREALTARPKNLQRGYQPVEIVTKDGRKLAGVLKNEDNFSLQLLDSQNRLQLLARDELRSIDYKPESLMPRDYDQRLTAGELQDLLAFLSRATRGARRTDDDDDEDDQ